MQAPPRTIFYADLNCPFCFAMNERLLSMGKHDDVEWRGVEHEPELPVPWGLDSAGHEELTDEVDRVCQRAPEAQAQRPPHRPNSRLAIATVAAAAQRDPELGARLRTAVFRALWRDGRDISDPLVLRQVCSEVGAPELGTDGGAQAIAAQWNEEWAELDLGRIPALIGPGDTSLLGLSTVKAVEVYFGVGFSSDTGLVCE